MVVFNHKQVIIDSLNTLTMATDSEDLLFHCLMPNQLSAAGPDWLSGLYFVVFLACVTAVSFAFPGGD